MKKVIVFLLLMNFGLIQAQDVTIIEKKLEELSKEQAGLKDVMSSEVSGLNLYQFINSVATEHQLNVDVDTNLTAMVEGNYFNLTVKEVLLFLIKKHDIQVSFINSFIVFKKKEEVIKQEPKPQKKELDITYREANDFLSVNLKRDSLQVVAEAITKKSGKNIILSPSVQGAQISGYFQNRPFQEILEMIGQSNGLAVTSNENGSFLIDKAQEQKGTDKNNNGYRDNSRKTTQKKGTSGFFETTLSETGYLTINAFETNVSDVIIDAAEKLHLNYYMYSIPSDVSTTIVASEITFDQLLETVFRGKEYTFSKDKTGFYYIGKRDEEGLRYTELLQMENRTVEKVLSSIPADIKKDIELKEFPELNGLVVSGSKPKVQELKEFLRMIDKLVPMVQLEVFIVQYNKEHGVQTGMESGLNTEGNPVTSGVLFPKTDVNLNAESVNGLIDLFNGFGIFNLGKVTEQFYLNLKFLENNSVVRLESTPKIATLSGHDATLKIGETSYYFEQRNNVVPLGNNNQVQQSGTWNPTEANLSVKIKPYVSKDEQITLELAVEKSSFLGRAGENAPPGKATQSFDSVIRVKNNEMVLLGGLDELNKENAGTGTPVISRIPILKWFFSGRSSKNKKSKLHLFVKPTVTY